MTTVNLPNWAANWLQKLFLSGHWDNACSRYGASWWLLPRAVLKLGLYWFVTICLIFLLDLIYSYLTDPMRDWVFQFIPPWTDAIGPVWDFLKSVWVKFKSLF